MILIITNRHDLTADFLIIELRNRGIDYIRFNTEDYPCNATITLTESLAESACTLQLSQRRLNLHEVRSVWFRRPVPPVVSLKILDPNLRDVAAKESLESIEGLWRVMDCLWVSRPDAVRRAESKPLQLHVARQLGFAVPETVLTNDPVVAKTFVSKHDMVVCKPLRCGQVSRGERVALIFANVLRGADKDELDAVRYAPTLLQQYIPKRGDIRVTVIGQEVFAVEIDSQACEETKHDWRRGENASLDYSIHELPPAVARQCRDLVRTLDLRFGAIDLVLSAEEDEYFFLEINPNGQWAWLQQRLPDLPLRETLSLYLAEGL